MPPPSLPQADTCSSIESLLRMPTSALSSLNPGLNCSLLTAGTVLCIERDASLADWNAPCTRPYLLRDNDTCDAIRRQVAQYDANGDVQPLPWMDFFRYNPGISCDRLFPPTPDSFSSLVQVKYTTAQHLERRGIHETEAEKQPRHMSMSIRM